MVIKENFKNKWEHVSERQLDEVIDHLNTLNDTTPKIKCQGRNGVDPGLIFGLQSKLFLEPSSAVADGDTPHHDEVETVTVYSGGTLEGHKHKHNESSGECSHCNSQESKDVAQGRGNFLERRTLVTALGALPKESIWRVKGFLRLCDDDTNTASIYILNWAFGRHDLYAVRDETAGDYLKDDEEIRLTVMGERGEVKRAATKFAVSIGGTVHR